jgi:POT family proton-dependent oligopeptide transporter
MSLVKVVPRENNLPKAIKVLSVAARNSFKLDHAKQMYQMERHGNRVPWDDRFVEELKRGLIACRVM